MAWDDLSPDEQADVSNRQRVWLGLPLRHECSGCIECERESV